MEQAVEFTKRWAFVITLVLSLGASVLAQQSDEQKIRDLVRLALEGKQAIETTDNAIFVSGPLPRPAIGKKDREQFKPIIDEIAKNRPNQKRESEIVRLVVSESKDMAYEFGNHKISWDAPDKSRTGFEGSYLRVWRKIGDVWKVDAFFARPNKPADAKAANPVNAKN